MRGTTAQRIIEQFGGQSALARLLGKTPGMVQYWSNAGTIPAKWQGRLLALARERGIPLTASDFIPTVTPTEEVTSMQAATGIPMLPAQTVWSATVPIATIEIPVHMLQDGTGVLRLMLVKGIPA